MGIDFNPKQWTSDNSGAIENGIIRVKGESVKAVLGSDKLHDENNIIRVLNTIPTEQQQSFRSQMKVMINGLSAEVSENIYECLLQKAKDSGYDKLARSLAFNYRKRHKYWKAYREVEDNNCTTEQLNRIQTRHCKSASLMDGVRKLVRSTISEKARFKLAKFGNLVSKGPTAKAREKRIEIVANKDLSNEIDSLEEMVNIQNEKDEDELKQKALADFKSKNSDTHRSDKVRKSKKEASVKTQIYNRRSLAKAKRKLKEEQLFIVEKNVSENDVVIKLVDKLGIEKFVNISLNGVTCTCPDFFSSFYCVDVLFLLKEMKLEKMIANLKKFGGEHFQVVKQHLGQIDPIYSKVAQPLNWKIERSRKNYKCANCLYVIKPGQLFGQILKQKYCVKRICIPKEYRKCAANIDVTVNNEESSNLMKNGIVTQ